MTYLFTTQTQTAFSLFSSSLNRLFIQPTVLLSFFLSVTQLALAKVSARLLGAAHGR